MASPPIATAAMSRLLTLAEPLCTGSVLERPNRFVLRVAFDAGPARVFLADPGALAFLEPGTTVLCRPIDDPERSTSHDAIAARVDGGWASLRAVLANDLFERALAGGHLPGFEGFAIERREPPLADGGRADFLVSDPAGEPAVVEVKSVTHAEDGVARFPDRPTERGRRHLAALDALVADGTAAHVVFVVQRPGVDRVEPYRDVDPAFADALAGARDRGVGVAAIATAFEPPNYRLYRPSLPVTVDA